MYKMFSFCCIFTGCRLVTATKASVFMSLLAADCLTNNSYSSKCSLKILDSLNRYIASAWTALKTSPNSSSIVASHSYRTDRVQNTASQLLHCCVLQICCLTMVVFAEALPSNDCLCWLHSSRIEEICHIIIILQVKLRELGCVLNSGCSE
jgi:hypothetical protein